ncbi:hypothetical protein [Actinoplanes rectilineatus]|uniref:hypothetical protein n=1 Tax=Actinoplanes rectilineatus TaxID=113571 RepID=UPI000AF2A2C7|nr:hypothetical protein [Actinoplanes rectilineatus]
MSADDHTSSGPAGAPVDSRRTLPVDATSAVIISRHQIECWAGRALTNGEMECLTRRIAASPIPQIIAQIVSQFGTEPTNEAKTFSRRRFINHSNDVGDWCPWSLTAIAVTASSDDRCPAGCANSAIEADNPDDEDPPNITDCQLCGAPGGYPYCQGNFGGRISCAEAVALDDSAQSER